MNKKKILSTYIIALIIAGMISFFALNSYKKAQQKLEVAQSLLYEYKIDEANTLFYNLKKSLWLNKQARLGCIITNILKDKAFKNIPMPDKDSIRIDNYHLPFLLRRQLASASFNKCVELAKIGRFYEVKAADLYFSVALLEKGEKEKAFRCFSKLPDKIKNSFPGIKLKETFVLLHKGAQNIIRDRTGKLVGTISSDNEFKFYLPAYRSLIQPVIIQEIINSGIQSGIRLSIDLKLSRLALESLGRNRGSIVLIKPDTGEVLAAVSDEKTRKRMGAASSPAFEQMLEPASISKLITITAAYRNKLDPEREIAGMNCRGAKRYSGKILYCPAAQGNLYGLEHALAVSCNTAFADLGVKVGWKKMLDELRLFGFNSDMENPFPLGKIIISKGDDRALADLAIGLKNTLTTPVHSGLIAAVFSSSGSWVNPQLLHAVDGFSGFSPQIIQRFNGKKILDEKWLRVIGNAMRAVTKYGGTAGFIAPFNFRVHMKTGTGGNYSNGFHINYIGYVPAEQGNITFCVRITGKRTSYRARRAGFNTTSKLLVQLKQFL